MSLRPDVHEISLSTASSELEAAPAGAAAIRVSAVLVAHDGAAFLPRTLDAILAQTRPPDRLMGVDAGSRDAGPELLERATGRVLRLDRDTSFGDAVQAALAALDSASLAQVADPRPAGPSVAPVAAAPHVVDWLWLLHDDSAPVPDTLAHLITAVDGGPSIGIAGCKHVSWDDDRRLLEVGFTTSRLGGRVTGVDVDDIDQGQLDHRSDVMAVGTAGMLVRRDLWDALGGTDPALAHARDDLDLCRRAHLAGFRVVVVPKAVMAHAAATANGRRGAGRAGWALRDRRAAVHLRLASVPLVLLPLLVLWLAGAAVLRAAGRLVLKQPDRAAAELAAFGLALSRPAAWARARRRLRRGRRLPRSDFRRLLAGPRISVRQRRDTLSAYLRRQEEAWTAPEAGDVLARAEHSGVVIDGHQGPSVDGAGASGTVEVAQVVDVSDAVDFVDAVDVVVDPVDAAGPAPAAGPAGGSVVAAGVLPPVLPRQWSGAGPGASATAAGGAAPPRRRRDRVTARRTGRPATTTAAAVERAGARPDHRIALVVVLIAGAAGVVGLHPLLRGTGTPIGPALLPSPATAGELWTSAMSGWRPDALGRAAAADPFDALLALVSWPFGASTRVATVLLLTGALPLAALVAWAAAGIVTRSRALRAWAALGWAAAPSLLTAVAAGRLPVIVAHLVLPAAGLALARTVGAERRPPGGREPAAVTSRRRRGSICAASTAGLAATVLLAAAPMLAVPVMVVLAVVAGLVRTGRRLIVWTAAVPGVVLLPWWLTVAADPRLLLAEPGGPHTTGVRADGWPAVLWPADPATATAWTGSLLRRTGDLLAGAFPAVGAPVWTRTVAVGLSLPLLVLALAALARRDRLRPALVLWTAALAGLGAATLAPAIDLRPGPAGLLRGWPGAGVSLLTVAVLAAALLRLDGTAGRLRSRRIGPQHWLAVGGGVLAVVAPVMVLAGWALTGWSAAPATWVHRGPADVLPAVAVAEAGGPAATRTLALTVGRGTVEWSLYRDGGPRTGTTSAAAGPGSAGAGDDPVLVVVGGLVSGSGRDQREQLADLGIGSVFVTAPVRADVVAALDTSPGLVPVVSLPSGRLWRVEVPGGRPARVRVLAADGGVLQSLPSDGTAVRARVDDGPAGRSLVLAEHADPGWRAELDGRRLEPGTRAGWGQAFALPTGGGVVTVRFSGRHDLDQAAAPVRLIVAALALLLAVPLPHRRLRLRPPPSAGPPVSGPPLRSLPRPARAPDEAGPRRRPALVPGPTRPGDRSAS